LLRRRLKRRRDTSGCIGKSWKAKPARNWSKKSGGAFGGGEKKTLALRWEKRSRPPFFRGEIKSRLEIMLKREGKAAGEGRGRNAVGKKKGKPVPTFFRKKPKEGCRKGDPSDSIIEEGKSAHGKRKERTDSRRKSLGRQKGWGKKAGRFRLRSKSAKIVAAGGNRETRIHVKSLPSSPFKKKKKSKFEARRKKKGRGTRFWKKDREGKTRSDNVKRRIRGKKKHRGGTRKKNYIPTHRKKKARPLVAGNKTQGAGFLFRREGGKIQKKRRGRATTTSKKKRESGEPDAGGDQKNRSARPKYVYRKKRCFQEKERGQAATHARKKLQCRHLLSAAQATSSAAEGPLGEKKEEKDYGKTKRDFPIPFHETHWKRRTRISNW